MRGALSSSFIIILLLLLQFTIISALICKSINAVKLSDNKYNKLWNTVGYKGKNNLDSSGSSSSRGGNTNQGDVNNRPSSTNRRKLGPPQRKLIDKNDISSLGRVSVYCVGSSINLLSLRAHVFRRGFSYNYYSKNKIESDSSNTSSTVSQDDVMTSLPNLMLSRRPEDVALDEEVLHISNAPSLYLSSALQSSRYNNYNSNNNQYNGNQYNGPPSKASSSSPPASSSSTIDTSTTTTTGGDAGTGTVCDSDKTIDNKDSISTTDPSSSDPNYNTGGGDVATTAPSSSSSSSTHADDSNEEALLTRSDRQLVMLTQDIFYFEYGCVVFWGLSQSEENAALTELVPFTDEPVTPLELQTSYDEMSFIFDPSANPNRPVRFDRMILRSSKTEEKLALSYAMAQSSKLFVFELKVLQSLEKTRFLPKELAKNGQINCNKKELNKIIGQLFVEQTEVNLFSSILDTPGTCSNFLWDDDEYVPSYQYTRSYLEVDERVELLNSRLSVIRELLDVLTAQVADNNSTRLEWIVVWLISIEIVLNIASNPIFAGKRLLSAALVPTLIMAYKKLGDGSRRRKDGKWELFKDSSL